MDDATFITTRGLKVNTMDLMHMVHHLFDENGRTKEYDAASMMDNGPIMVRYNELTHPEHFEALSRTGLAVRTIEGDWKLTEDGHQLRLLKKL